MAKPIIFIFSISIPCALLITGLLPVDLIALPCSVPKYQYKIPMTAAVITAATGIDFSTYLPET